MIKSKQHAEQIQERRVAQHKRGFAKAVRRFVGATEATHYRAILNSFSSLPIPRKSN